MKIKFENNEQLSEDELEVTISAVSYNEQARNVMDYLTRFDQNKTEAKGVITASGDDRIAIIHASEIVALEVIGETLTIVTLKQEYTSRQRLYKVLAQLNTKDFVQVSRGVAINLTYLDALEGGFSGNMTAILITGRKENVSRKYLGEVKTHFGL